MNLNWFTAEMLMKQRQREIKRSAKEAWKWSDDTQKQSGRFFSRRPKHSCNTNGLLRYESLLIL
ncbi:hypothetical protein LJK88_26395 [Paenibacillus sp. P26]|nr:hypothetical protein LJK88_26395 [Paenibacillus sp. P26]UUZ95081.1 hypothetical protein LJK87_11575 [Paenibacillus sp. P25]